MYYGFRVSGYGFKKCQSRVCCKRKRIWQDTNIQEGSHPGSGELGQPFFQLTMILVPKLRLVTYLGRSSASQGVIKAING